MHQKTQGIAILKASLEHPRRQIALRRHSTNNIQRKQSVSDAPASDHGDEQLKCYKRRHTSLIDTNQVQGKLQTEDGLRTSELMQMASNFVLHQSKFYLLKSAAQEHIVQMVTEEFSFVTARTSIKQSKVSKIFSALVLLNIAVNFDSGAVPALLEFIRKDFELQPVEQGMLGGLQYLGLTIMCPISGYLLQKYRPKRIIGMCMLANIMCCLGFAFAPNKGLLLLARFLIGITQSTLVVYAPVWADAFAGEGFQGTWMAILQASIPLGVMIGYTVSGAMASAKIPWPFAFVVQTCMLAPLVLGLLLLPNKYVGQDGGNESKYTSSAKTPGGEETLHRADAAAGGYSPGSNLDESHEAQTEIQAPPAKSCCALLTMLLRSRVFVFSTCGLSSLYFVVTGIQFWATDYMVDVIGARYTVVLTWFAVTSATAPVAGVIFGGWVVDKLGGYNGARGMALTSRAGLVSSILAATFGVLAGRETYFPKVIVLAWFVLFFGGAIVPGATGMVLNSVDKSLRAFSSAMSMFWLNIFGFSAGTMVPGMYMEFVEGSYSEKLANGFRLVLYWSFVGVVFVGLVAWETTTQWRNELEDVNRSKEAESETDAVGSQQPEGGTQAKPSRATVNEIVLQPGAKVKTSFGPGRIISYRTQDGVYELHIGNSSTIIHMHRSQFKIHSPESTTHKISVQGEAVATDSDDIRQSTDFNAQCEQDLTRSKVVV